MTLSRLRSNVFFLEIFSVDLFKGSTSSGTQNLVWKWIMVKLQPIPASWPWQVPAPGTPLAPDPLSLPCAQGALQTHNKHRHQSQLPFLAAATAKAKNKGKKMKYSFHLLLSSTLRLSR